MCKTVTKKWPKSSFCQISFNAQKSITQHMKKIVSGELKGPFELHLDVIWGPEDQ